MAQNFSCNGNFFRHFIRRRNFVFEQEHYRTGYSWRRNKSERTLGNRLISGCMLDNSCSLFLDKEKSIKTSAFYLKDGISAKHSAKGISAENI